MSLQYAKQCFYKQNDFFKELSVVCWEIFFNYEFILYIIKLSHRQTWEKPRQLGTRSIKRLVFLLFSHFMTFYNSLRLLCIYAAKYVCCISAGV